MSKYSEAYIFAAFIHNETPIISGRNMFDFPRVYKLLMTFSYQKFFSLGCQNVILKALYTSKSGRSHRTQSQSHELVTHISTSNLVPIKSECRCSYVIHLQYLM